MPPRPQPAGRPARRRASVQAGSRHAASPASRTGAGSPSDTRAARIAVRDLQRADARSVASTRSGSRGRSSTYRARCRADRDVLDPWIEFVATVPQLAPSASRARCPSTSTGARPLRRCACAAQRFVPALDVLEHRLGAAAQLRVAMGGRHRHHPPGAVTVRYSAGPARAPRPTASIRADGRCRSWRTGTRRPPRTRPRARQLVVYTERCSSGSMCRLSGRIRHATRPTREQLSLMAARRTP